MQRNRKKERKKDKKSFIQNKESYRVEPYYLKKNETVS